jgi:hypothetical protein
MGIGVVIEGESASGKSSTMRNCDPKALAIFNVADKPFPFRQKFPMVIATADVNQIVATLKRNTTNMYVIDDSQYLMSFKLIDKINEAGYQKYTQIAKDFKLLVDTITKETSPDTIVYFLHHTEKDSDGFVHAKTSGQLINNWLTFEGLFSIVLMAKTIERRHVLVTVSDGTNTVKAPMGMFDDEEIDNDLTIVDKAIRDYYELAPAGKRKVKEMPANQPKAQVNTTNKVPAPAEKVG